MDLSAPQPRGRRVPRTKILLPQTAHDSAKLFSLRQFKDVGSMTFFFIVQDRQKTRRKVSQFGAMTFF